MRIRAVASAEDAREGVGGLRAHRAAMESSTVLENLTEARRERRAREDLVAARAPRGGDHVSLHVRDVAQRARGGQVGIRFDRADGVERPELRAVQVED